MIVCEPSTCKLPVITRSPAIEPVPAIVTSRKPAISLLLSTTTAFEAATVPAVTPSIVSNSASLMSAEPITRLPAVTAPVAVRLRKLDASLLLSTTTALLAATVPSVMPSSFSRSASDISAEPTTSLEPESAVKAVIVPVPETFLKPVASLFPSTTTAFEASTVPAVVTST